MSKSRTKALERLCKKDRTEEKDLTGSTIAPGGVMLQKQNEVIALRRNKNGNRNKNENKNVDAGSVSECVPGCLYMKYALPSLV